MITVQYILLLYVFLIHFHIVVLYMPGSHKWSAFVTFSKQSTPMLCTFSPQFDCHVKFFKLHFAGDYYCSAVVSECHHLRFPMGHLRKLCGFVVSVVNVNNFPLDMQM